MEETIERGGIERKLKRDFRKEENVEEFIEGRRM